MRKRMARVAGLGTTVALLITMLGVWRGAAAQPGIANIRVSHDAVPFHAEPSVAVNPEEPSNLLAASQLIPEMGPTTIGTFASFDGGRTWRDNGPLPFPAGANTGDDVTVAFAPNGHGFVAAMVTSETNGSTSQLNRSVAVWRTDDGGRTFAPPVLAIHHEFVDHPWLAIAAMPGAGAGALYVAWVTQDHRGLGFTRSLDDGKTFAARRTIVRPPGGVSIPVAAAGPDGAVSIAYETGINGADPFAVDADQPAPRPAPAAQESGTTDDARIEVIGSTDGGATFGSPIALGAVPSEPALPGNVHLPTGPSMATDPRSGAVYVTYVAYRPGTDQLDVMLARSQQGGRTWSAPTSVTAASATAQTDFFQPQVVVDAADGVDVTAFALAHGRVDVMAWRASPPGSAFAPGRRVTSVAFDPAKGLPRTKHGAWWIGDYQGLAASVGTLYPLWNDTRTGNLDLFVAAVPLGALGPGAATPIAPATASPVASPATTATVARVTADPRYPDAAEPSLAINSRDPANLLGAAQFFAGPGPHPVIGTFASFDGGASWQDQAPLPLPSGVTLANDVTVAFDGAGHGFVAAGLGTVVGEGGVAVWRTSDGGRTFAPPVRVASAGGDHPWLAVAPGPGPRGGTLYLAWSGPGHRQLLFSRSSDGGRTFAPARVISGPGDVHPDLAVVTVGRAGTVYVVYGTTEVVASTDGGRTFSAPRPLPSGRAAPQTGPVPALNTLPAAVADPTSGMLYVATADPLATTGRRAILLWRTPDAGRTWADPVPVPLDPTHAAAAYQPALAVGPGGWLTVSAYLVRDGRVTVAVAWSRDRGATFVLAPPVAPAFNPTGDLKASSETHFKQTGALPWIGDYQGLAAGANAVYPCWTDTRSGHLAIFVAVVPVPATSSAKIPTDR